MVAARNIPTRAGRPLQERAASDFQAAYDIQASYLDQIGDHPKSELLMAWRTRTIAWATKTKRAHILRSC